MAAQQGQRKRDRESSARPSSLGSDMAPPTKKDKQGDHSPDLGPARLPGRVELDFMMDFSKQTRHCTIMVPGGPDEQCSWDDVALPEEDSILGHLAHHNLVGVSTVQVDAYRCDGKIPDLPALVEVLVPLLGIYEIVLTAAGGDSLRDAIGNAFESAVQLKFPSLALVKTVETWLIGRSYAYTLSPSNTNEMEWENIPSAG